MQHQRVLCNERDGERGHRDDREGDKEVYESPDPEFASVFITGCKDAARKRDLGLAVDLLVSSELHSYWSGR